MLFLYYRPGHLHKVTPEAGLGGMHRGDPISHTPHGNVPDERRYVGSWSAIATSTSRAYLLLLDYCSLNRFLTYPENIVSSSADGEDKRKTIPSHVSTSHVLIVLRTFALFEMYAIVTKSELWVFIICSLVKSPVGALYSANLILQRVHAKKITILCNYKIHKREFHPCVTYTICTLLEQKSRRWCR